MKRTEIAQLLPTIFQRTIRPGNPLFALLDVMEGLTEPIEAALEQIDAVFDPRRTPEAFVPFLAGWLDLDRLFDVHADDALSTLPRRAPITTGLGRLRELIAAASYLSQWRGTAKGLCLFLEIATNINGFEIDEQVPGDDGQPRPFHLRIRVPEAAKPHRALIERIIESEKPAYVTYELADGQPSPGGS
jgi:phage tail-like protein